MQHLSQEEKEYYRRQLILSGFGEYAQQKLKSATVLIVGAGGLGCPVVQYLSAAGVGKIVIADGDAVAKHNLHRQVLYSPEDIGKNKALAAVEKLQKQYPHVQLIAFPNMLSNDNINSLINDATAVCDCSDNFSTRYLVNDQCLLSKKPLISAAVAEYSGQLSVFSHKTNINYRDVFAEEDATSQTCANAGIWGALCGIIGSMQANEVIKIITEIGDTLEGKLLTYDALTHKMHIFKISHNTEQKENASIAYSATHIEKNTNTKILNSAAFHQLRQQKQEIHLIDVREAWEYEESNIGGINIPLMDLTSRMHEFDKNDVLVFYCHSGKRSQTAVRLFLSKGYDQLYIFLPD